MVPWVERPVIMLDLDAPIGRRYDVVSREAVVAGKQLLDSVMRFIPRSARWLTPWVV